MRHQDIGRLRGVDGVWFRISLWLGANRKSTPAITDLNMLTDHQRRDIGVPEPTRYLDWKALRTEGQLPDFTR
jgi:hypothetical protein